MRETAQSVAVSDSSPVVPVETDRTQTKAPGTNNGGGKYPWWKTPALVERYSTFRLLREQGLTAAQAAETLGYARETGATIDKRIKDFEAKKVQSGASLDFLTPKRLKRASFVVDKLMQGKTFGDIKEIKDSTALRAAETVLDRQFPKRSESESPNISFVQVNLNLLASGSPANPAPALPVGDVVELEAIASPADPGPVGDGV